MATIAIDSGAQITQIIENVYDIWYIWGIYTRILSIYSKQQSPSPHPFSFDGPPPHFERERKNSFFFKYQIMREKVVFFKY